ncbi:MAG: 3-methyl-2-oxobutanoate dehydrogenase subunit beta [Lachnospiraceae bacterium]|nr:3-methyl-2-oxobutanoate dehydrogenase subunit beta [Lachnospiraceae bacterium]
MSEKIFMKGCEAVAEAAIRAGCRFYAGYPITPQNEVPEYLSRMMPKVGGVFLQGESEVASANMLYAGGVSGTRSMTTSSSCGISLMSEAISWMALQHVPTVIGNFARGGPGIGSIQPSQQDYMQATKASGNGGFQMIVLAPATVQEAVDMTYEAFDLADKYSFPTYILLDGFIGTMMEPVVLPPAKTDEEIAAIKASKKWVPNGSRGKNSLDQKGTLDYRNEKEAEMYEEWKKTEVKYETYLTEDAEVILTGYGISARIAKSVVNDMRKEGYKVGFIRPLRVNPFPEQAFEDLDYSKVRGILCTELSKPALYAVDVKNVVRGRCPVETALRSGGEIITADEIYEAAVKLYGEK